MVPRMARESFVGKRLYFVASGAGCSFQKELWMVPGTSSFLVGASFPYAKDDTDEFLGFAPEKYCSRDEALQLAMEAYMRARRAPGGEPIGMALTAAVSSCDGPPRRGEHRVFVAVISPKGAYVMKRVLKKDPGFGRTQRLRDETDANLVAEDMLRVAIGEWELADVIEANLGNNGVTEFEKIEENELLDIFFKHPYFGQSGARGAQEPATMEAFYPGTFNSLHDGHRSIVHNLGTSDACYMVNVDSVHKPGMSITQILDTAAQFRTERLQWRNGSVLFTRGEALFVDKFKNRPEKIFVVGVDTFERMMDPKWGPDPTAGVLKTIYDNGNYLYVCDRIVDGVLKSAHAAIERLIPPGDPAVLKHRQVCAIDVEPSALSSSAIRAAKG